MGFAIRLDAGTRRVGADLVTGGLPWRVLRLNAAGLAAWQALLDGPVTSAATGALARRLCDAGLAHPVPPACMPPPQVSVIVPVLDRAAELDRALTALGRAHPVLVVDDGSSDPAAIRAVAQRHGAQLVRRERTGGPGAARNTGLAHAGTEFVAFLDSDTEPSPGWIEALAPHLADPALAAIAPRIVGSGHSAPARYAHSRGALDLGPHPGPVAPGTAIAYVPTAALLARRSALLDVAQHADIFDETLRYGEDVDLIWRLHAAGHRIRYEPAVTVAHHEPSTWPALMRRRFHYGSSAADLAGRHPGAMAPLVIEPWSTAVVVAALACRPRTAALLAGAAVLAENRARRSSGAASGAAPAVARRTRTTLHGLGTYATQFAAPALLAATVHPRTRAAAGILALAPPLLDRLRTYDPTARTGTATYVLGHLGEDLAYGAGVLSGSLRARSTTALRPVWSRRTLGPTRPTPPTPPTP
ncbi:MAG: mycofactocin biosynthesis glycosyltransferase MftF [Sporichthyaceae bacterium]